MLSDNALFFSVLVAVIIIIIVSLVFVAKLLIENKGQEYQLETTTEASRNIKHKCAHSLGYLSTLRGSQPIPDECFSCLLALDCKKATPKPTEGETGKEKHGVSNIGAS